MSLCYIFLLLSSFVIFSVDGFGRKYNKKKRLKLLTFFFNTSEYKLCSECFVLKHFNNDCGSDLFESVSSYFL